MVTNQSSEVANDSTVALAKKMFELRSKKRDLESQVEELDTALDQVKNDLKTQMEELGLQKFGLEGIGTFYLQSSFFPKIVGDKEQLIQWLDSTGKSDIAPRTVHMPSLREMYENNLENDLPVPPPDLVEASTEISVRLRQSKK